MPHGGLTFRQKAVLCERAVPAGIETDREGTAVLESAESQYNRDTECFSLLFLLRRIQGVQFVLFRYCILKSQARQALDSAAQRCVFVQQ